MYSTKHILMVTLMDVGFVGVIYGVIIAASKEQL